LYSDEDFITLHPKYDDIDQIEKKKYILIRRIKVKNKIVDQYIYIYCDKESNIYI